MRRRDLILVILVAGAAGFIGGFVGGTLTGDFHIYIDSFTGPDHTAGSRYPDTILPIQPTSTE